MNKNTINESSWYGITKIAGVATLLQIGYIIVAFVLLSMLGNPPSTVLEYYTMMNTDPLRALMFMDAPMIILLISYYFTSFGILAVYRKKYPAYMILLTALVFVAITLAIATNEVFSMMYLSDQYAMATTDAARSQILAAGEAIFASSLWHTTAGFITGIFMQGPFVIFSAIMLKSTEFSRKTAYTGILSNGLDLFQHLIKLFVPTIAYGILIIAGVIYVFWYIFLGIDFFRFRREDLY